jgi:hypothetical protein
MAPDPDTLAEVMRLRWKKGLTLKEAWSKVKKKAKSKDKKKDKPKKEKKDKPKKDKKAVPVAGGSAKPKTLDAIKLK